MSATAPWPMADADAMAAKLRSERRGDCLVLTLNHAPVNSLPWPLRCALWLALKQADVDTSLRAVILIGAGKGFSAGGEFSEIGTPLNAAQPTLSNDLFPVIEGLSKPVIAAIHGFAMGGGLELAMACHYRVARRDAKLALPEVRHGLIPPSGTQRLPRAVGVERALSLMVPAATLRAHELQPGPAGLDAPLFASLVEGDVLEAALAVAASLGGERLSAQGLAAVLLRQRRVPDADAASAIQAWRDRLAADPQSTQAQRVCVDAVELAVHAGSFDEGLREAKRRYDELAMKAKAQHP